MTELCFEDRQGCVHYPDSSSTVKTREGVFSCCVFKGRILLIWPEYAPNIPELAGGGIDAEETISIANQREFMEETGLVLPFSEGEEQKSFHQTVNFYADDVDEYWFYTQTFFLFDGMDNIFFEGKRSTPEAGVMEWVSLDEAKMLPIHFMHRKAIKAFGIF